MILIILLALNLFLYLRFRKFSKIINVFDEPISSRKIHKRKVSVLGGLFFLINVSLLTLIDIFFSINLSNKIFNNNELISILAIYLLFWMIGIYDDKNNLRPLKKIYLYFFLIFLFLILNKTLLITELRFQYFNININSYIYSFIFTAFCIFIFQNAFNMFDGTDLQIGNYIFFTLLFLIFFKPLAFLIYLLIPLFFFYILNYKKICFLGNNGSISISFIFAIFFIKFYHFHIFIYVEEIILSMFIPVLDMTRLYFYRVYLLKSPMNGDNNHIHHILSLKFKKNLTLQIVIAILVLFPSIIYLISNNFIFSFISGFTLYFSLILFTKY